MTSDEARAEAESFSWAEYRREVAPNTRHAGREAVAFKAGFDAGAGWQAERDAERIAELEAEVERLRMLVPPCDGGCSYGDGPQEDCSAHGRRPAELWEIIQQEAAKSRDAQYRAEAAEAKLDAVRMQAGRDAERIAEMEAEAERLRAAHDLVRETVLTQADAAGAVKAFAKMLAAGDDIKRLEATLTAATTAMVEAENRTEQADAERDALAAVIERVRALHKFIPAGIGGISLAACSCGVTAPCPTWSALNDKAEKAREGDDQ